MTSSEERPELSLANFQFLRQQVLLFQGFALALARESRLTPQEAGLRFWQGLAQGSSPRSVDAAELERIVQVVAEDTRLIYGNAQVERAGERWKVVAALADQDRATLERWGVPLEYVAAWLGEVQRHEGENIGVNWTVRLEENLLVQELTLRT